MRTTKAWLGSALATAALPFGRLPTYALATATFDVAAGAFLTVSGNDSISRLDKEETTDETKYNASIVIGPLNTLIDDAMGTLQELRIRGKTNPARADLNKADANGMGALHRARSNMCLSSLKTHNRLFRVAPL